MARYWPSFIMMIRRNCFNDKTSARPDGAGGRALCQTCLVVVRCPWRGIVKRIFCRRNEWSHTGCNLYPRLHSLIPNSV